MPEPKIRDTVREIVSLQLGVAERQIQDEVPLSEPPLGADELDMMELIMELEEEFDISIPDRMITSDDGSAKTVSVNDLVGMVRARLSEEPPKKAAKTPAKSPDDARHDPKYMS